MFDRISEEISNELINQKVVSEFDRDIYRYGIQQGLGVILNYAVVIGIGTLLGMFTETVVYVIFYTLLRIFAGGYHAKTPVRCLITYTVIVTTSLLLIKYLPLNTFICSLLFILSGSVIMLSAPVEDDNKPLDEVEKRIYHKRVCFIIVAESIVFLISCIFSLKWLYLPILLETVSICFLIVAGKINNTIHK